MLEEWQGAIMTGARSRERIIGDKGESNGVGVHKGGRGLSRTGRLL